jgi:glycosyltransferase involved in cell wall biosynthesis
MPEARRKLNREKEGKKGVSMIPISVVTIAKNEEKRIGDCIKSVSGWADEIIVVDDESTDKTRELAESLGAKVFVRKMHNEGKHRNWAIGQAKNEWVLSLDCDERLTPELKKEMAETIKDTAYQGFSFPFRNYIGDYWIRGGGYYPACKLRLFKKSFFRYKEESVHPPMEFSGVEGRLKSDIIHLNYKDWADHLRKTNNQTTLEAEKWYNLSLANPKKAGRKMNTIHALWRMVDRFMRGYFGKKGYRDGFTGFMMAFLSSLYQILSYAKYREIEEKKGSGLHI